MLERHVDDIVGLFRSAGTIFFGKILSQAIKLGVRILALNALVPARFGTLALSYSIVTVASGIVIFGLDRSVTRFIAGADTIEERNDAIQSSWILGISAGVIGFLVLFVARRQIAGLLDEPALVSLLSVFAVYVFFFPLERLVVGTLRGFEKSAQVVLVRNILSLTISSAVFIFFLATGAAYRGLMVFWIISPFITVVFGLYFIDRRVRLVELINRRVSIRSLKEIIGFCAPLALSSISVILLTEMDTMMISYFRQSSSVGLYKSVQPLPQILMVFLVSFEFLYLPVATRYYSNGESGQLERLFQTSTKWIVLLSFPITAVMFFYPLDIINVLYSKEYIEASTALSILVVGSLLRLIVGLNGTTLQAMDKPQFSLYSVIVALVLNLVLNFALVQRFGIVGAAIATSVSFFIQNIIELYTIFYFSDIHPFTAKTYRAVVLTLLLTCILKLFVVPSSGGLIGLILISITVSLFHVFFIVLSGTIDQTDLFFLDHLEQKTSMDMSNIKYVLRHISRIYQR